MPTELAQRTSSVRHQQARHGLAVLARVPPLVLTLVLLVMLSSMLGGCATRVDVRPMATGRSDVSAYELNGADVHRLRQEAQRLCPLGGEIVREASHGLPPEADAGHWRSTLNTLAAWAQPPRRPAQMVVVCREGGDRYKLQLAVPQQPVAAVARAATDAAELTAALPVGPINPEW